MQSAREEEWEKIAQLEQGKLQLEAGVKQLERSKAASEVALNTEKEKLEEKLRSTDKMKSLAEAECSQLKAELQGLQNILQDLEKEWQDQICRDKKMKVIQSLNRLTKSGKKKRRDYKSK